MFFLCLRIDNVLCKSSKYYYYLQFIIHQSFLQIGKTYSQVDNMHNIVMNHPALGVIVFIIWSDIIIFRRKPINTPSDK